MSTVSLTGADTVVMNGRTVTDLADGDCIMLTFPNDLASVKTGKNGNAIYAVNETGRQSEMKMRLIRGSADDKFFNNLLVQQRANFAGFVLLDGNFIKKLGDGKGNITSDTYVVSGGIFSKQVEAKTNTDGDTTQSVSEYTFKFSNAPRAIT